MTMVVTQPRTGNLAELLAGMGQMMMTVPFAPVLRLWYNHWGATPEETARPLPGDVLNPNPKLRYTRAITIHAPAAKIWPWLAQMGQGRGGLYSYDALENLIGCDLHSADRIVPEWQNLKVGDHVLFGPAEKKFPGQYVAEFEPERYILMYALDPVTRQPVESATWVFYLDQKSDASTRLIVRSHNTYAAGMMNHVMWHIVEPLNFVMERRMLRGIKRRAEARM